VRSSLFSAANVFAERFVPTIGRARLDRMLIFNRPCTKTVRKEFVEHCNGYRPHRSADQS
jgi:hypothetical protein